MRNLEQNPRHPCPTWQKARIIKNELAPWLVGQEIWIQGQPHPPDETMCQLEHNGQGDLRNSKTIKGDEDMRLVFDCSLYDGTTGGRLWYRFDEGLELLNEFCADPPMVSFQELLKKKGEGNA